MIVEFQNIEHEKIRKSFLRVLNQYKTLHDFEILLNQRPIKSSTMQAQPVLNWRGLFFGIRQYRVKLAIHVRDSQHIKVSELPGDVLTGWFAHELGHVVDYGSYNSLGMIGYGLRYLLSSSFKKKVEHKADEIAISHGFKSEILETKRFILDHDLLDEGYKNKIRKYYMPIEAVEAWRHDIPPGIPHSDL